MTTTTRLRVRLLAVLLPLLIALALVAVTGEVAVRYRERHRTTVPGTMPMLFYRHERLGHALVRNYDYFGWVHIDGQGFRGAPVQETKPDSVFRIMVVGASTTFDTGVSADDKTWPSQLEKWLLRLSPGIKVEVINAGVPGYRVVQNTIRLQTELFRYQPDLVVYYETHNDLFAALRNKGRTVVSGDRPGEVPAVTPWTRWLERHSLLYNKLAAKWQAVAFGLAGRKSAGVPPATDESPAVVLDRGTAQFERDLTSLLVVAQGLGLRVAVPEVVQVSGVGAVDEPDSATRAMWHQAMPFAAPETVLEGYRRYGEAIRRVTGRLGVPFVATNDFGLAGREWYVDGDPIHFNDRGAERMGEQMARALLDAGIVPAKPGAVPAAN